jgi:hypothetical protein
MQNMGTKRVGRRGGNATFMAIPTPGDLIMAIATPRDLPRGWLRTQQLHGTCGTVIKAIKGDADTNHVAPIVGMGVSSIVVGGLLLMFVRRRRTALE